MINSEIRKEDHRIIFWEIEDLGKVELSYMGRMVCLKIDTPYGKGDYLLSLDEAENMAYRLLDVVKAIKSA